MEEGEGVTSARFKNLLRQLFIVDGAKGSTSTRLLVSEMKETLPSMRVTNVNLAKNVCHQVFEIDLQNRAANDCVHNFTCFIQESIKVYNRKKTALSIS